MRTPVTQPKKKDSVFVQIASLLYGFLAFLVPYIFFFGLLALLVKYVTGSKDFAWNVVIYGPIITHIVIMTLGFKWAYERYIKTWNHAWSTLGHVDYFYARAENGLSIDSKAQEVAITVCTIAKTNDCKTIKLKLDKIKSIQYSIKEVPKTGPIRGYNDTERMKGIGESYQERKKATEKTGIYIKPDEISSVEHFVQMPKEQIEIWKRIFDKAVDGKLEPTERPVDTEHV